MREATNGTRFAERKRRGGAVRVLVCGGRNYDDRELVRIVLDRIHKETPITAIIHGAAPGADTLAGWWATVNEVSNQDYPADWKKHGKAAGPIRNLQMLTEGRPDMVLAFPGGRGTANMVDQAILAGVVVEHAAREREDAIDASVTSWQRQGPSR